ncbi:MAG: zf-HC2 domain-containing protein [Bryobacterales bacterium]|nr:zf-HC2 domain-containing protein [Bryobacterales bacterium]
MSTIRTHHPEEGELLRFADGELAAREAARVRSHLEACWRCRSELEELQAAITGSVRYHKEVVGDCLPVPPAPWRDIYAGFARVDASLARRPVLDRLRDLTNLLTWSARRWVPVSIVLALLAGILFEFRSTPSAQAAELLEKAVAAAQSKPRAERRIRIRSRKQTLTRVVGAAGWKNASAAAPDLEALFRKARYNWDDPLSAQSFMDWRDRLPDKQDDVATVADPLRPDARCYRVRTTTNSGILAETTLKLRTGDLQPVESTFQFGGQEWVEIAELPAPPDLAAEAPAAPAPVPQPVSIPSPGDPEPQPAAPAATPGEEVRVFDALNRIGADLGDPIEVARSGGRILVTGSGVAPERQREVEVALRSLPDVVVRFPGSSGAESLPQPPGRADLTVTGEPSRLASQLEEYFGGHVQFEQFAAQVLDRSEAVMSRAYALRRLAERFPGAVEAQMNPGERRLLGDLNRRHADALLKHASEMHSLLNQALPAGVPAPGGQSATLAGPWQSAAGELFQTARGVDVLLAALVGGSPAQEPPAGAAERLTSSAAHLRAVAAGYQHLLENPPEDTGR